jgi:hypothetical protein
MIVDWPLITVLFCLSVPGSVIMVKRLVNFLLPDNTQRLKNRIIFFAIIQTLAIVLIMCFAGAVLSKITGLRAPILEVLLGGQSGMDELLPILLPALFYSFCALLVFCLLYHYLAKYVIDEKSLNIITQLRRVMGLDGCILYGGVVEEIIGRWGLMNLATFFALIFMNQISPLIVWLSILISGLIFSVGQLPAYIAAGCTSSRRFIYSFILLSLCQSVFFGYVFWQYGLVCSILAHMFFHLGWALYATKSPQGRK